MIFLLFILPIAQRAPAAPYFTIISSSSSARYAPSLHSNSTLPLSKHSSECHLSFSTFSILVSPLASSTTLSVSFPPSSKKCQHILPRRITTVSDECRCRCIAITVPGSRALSILCDPSSGLFRKSKFILSLGEDFADAVNSSSIFWSIILFIGRC